MAWTQEDRREWQRAWRLRNRDSHLAARRNYAERNKEKMREQARAGYQRFHKMNLLRRAKYRATHQEKENAARRKRYAQDPQKDIQTSKAWFDNHPGAHTIYARQRRQLQAGLPNTLTSEEWANIVASYRYRCVYCQKQCKMTLDHIIPVSKGGGTTAHNIVPACKSCNSKKHTGPPLIPVMAVLI